MQGDRVRIGSEHLTYSVTEPHHGRPIKIRNPACAASDHLGQSCLLEHNNEHCFNTHLVGFLSLSR